MNKNFYKKLLIIITAILISGLPVFSLELDLSVDEEIKKKYNTTQLENDVLPNLPQIDSSSKTSTPASSSPTTPPKTLPVYTSQPPVITKIDKKDAIKISRWTKFQVKSNQLISDWAHKGAVVKFTSTSPVYKKKITIPSGTVFQAVIEDVHRPQITGNGGLLVLRVTNMSYNGKSIPINAKITKANSKKIFLNNIKGKRQYWKNVAKQIDKGENFYKKTRNTSSKLADNPIGLIISPIPTIVGIAGYAVNTASSPVIAIFSKGGNLSIPAGSSFEIKLLEPAYVY